MNSDAIRDELLKVDRLGRVCVSRQRREALLDAFESCGVSGVEFAAHVGVKYQTFATWRQKRNRQRQACGVPVSSDSAIVPPPRTGVRWLEAVLESAGSEEAGKASSTLKGACVLSITLPGGALVELSNSAQLDLVAGLLRALEAKGGGAC